MLAGRVQRKKLGQDNGDMNPIYNNIKAQCHHISRDIGGSFPIGYLKTAPWRRSAARLEGTGHHRLVELAVV